MRDQMNTRLRGYALVVLICSFAPQAMAQRWLTELPQDKREQPTINDLRQAFESYYREHPVDLKLDKLEPTLRFEGAQEEKERLDVEEYKCFAAGNGWSSPELIPADGWTWSSSPPFVRRSRRSMTNSPQSRPGRAR